MNLNKKKRLWILGSVVGLLLIGGISRYFLVTSKTPHYLTALVKRMDIEDSVLASGTLKPINQVSVGAQVNGQLKSLKVALGDRVSRGQWLAEIDPIQQENELRKAEAGLAQARANKRAKNASLRQYRLEFQRQQILVANDAGSRSDL